MNLRPRGAAHLIHIVRHASSSRFKGAGRRGVDSVKLMGLLFSNCLQQSEHLYNTNYTPSCTRLSRRTSPIHCTRLAETPTPKAARVNVNKAIRQVPTENDRVLALPPRRCRSVSGVIGQQLSRTSSRGWRVLHLELTHAIDTNHACQQSQPNNSTMTERILVDYVNKG